MPCLSRNLDPGLLKKYRAEAAVTARARQLLQILACKVSSSVFALPDIGRTLWSEALEAVFHAWLQGLLCVREVEEAGMQMPAPLAQGGRQGAATVQGCAASNLPSASAAPHTCGARLTMWRMTD